MKRSVGSSLLVSALIAGVAAASIAGAQGCSATPKNTGFGTVDASSTDAGVAPDADIITDLEDARANQDDAAICATASGKKQLVPVVLEFVVDGSASMSGAPWTAQVAALKAVFADFAATKDPNLAVGMIVFQDDKDVAVGGVYPGSNDVFPQVFSPASSAPFLNQLNQRVSGNARGGTPTFAAISGGYQVLEGLILDGTFARAFKRVVVLLTDGDPTDRTQSEIVTLVKTKANKAVDPILTFSIGVGAGVPAQFMSDIATEGKTAPFGCVPGSSSPANSCYFPIVTGAPVATITQDFIAAINTIRGRASACEYLIELTDDSNKEYNPNQVNVTFKAGDGTSTTLLKDPQNGWSYDDDAKPTKVILHGTSCDKVKIDKKGDVNIALGCPTKVQ